MLFNLLFVPISSFLASASATCTIIPSLTHTFYGYPDNDPPGPATAYSCGNRNYTAGGVGTYTDPLTFASAPGEFAECEVIYDPFLQKYLRHEDYCAACTTDWEEEGIGHIDVWTGSVEYAGEGQVECENELTPAVQSQQVVREPAADLPVDATALYEDGECRVDHLYWDYDVDDYCS